MKSVTNLVLGNATGGTARLVIANNGNMEVGCKRFAKRNAVPEKSILGGLFRFAADVRLSPTQLRFIINRYQNDCSLRSVSSLTLAGRRSCLYKPIVIAYFNDPDFRALLIQPFFLIIHTDYYQYSRQSLENGWVVKNPGICRGFY